MTSRMRRTSLDDLVRQVNTIVRFPRSSSARAEFRMNLCIVALGIRAGYLIDSFLPDDGEEGLQRLLSALRQAAPCFEDLRLVYTAEHQQYFFVNIPLLRERAKVLESPSSNNLDKKSNPKRKGTAFVLLDQTDQTEKLISTPSDVVETVKQIIESSEDPIPLPKELTARTLVPLSGFLLEYPIAYVPSSANPIGFLSGIEVDVYECSIATDHHHAKEHALLRFSCAAHLLISCNTLAPSTIIKELEQLFRGRLKEASCSRRLKITHSVVSQARVAL